MQLTSSQKLTIRYQFVCVCIRGIRNEGRNYEKKRKTIQENEVPFSELPDYLLSSLYQNERFFFENTYLTVLGKKFLIKDERLAKAINSLAAEKKSIILLSYFEDMTDKEIAELLNSYRSTVQRKKSHSIRELKGKLEADLNGKYKR